MNGTPRLRSGFPTTPGTVDRRRLQQQTPSTIGSVSSNGRYSRSPALPLAPENVSAKGASVQPVIPLTVADAPTQRFYAIALYACLFAVKICCWVSVSEEGEGSWSMFLTWAFVDLVYLFGLPELRIPWLEWSQSFVTCLYLIHLVMDGFLMFLVPIPLFSGLLAFFKVMYEREISISEQNVKVANILNNHSLIMGKQIINILPEGSAVLNPDNTPFCLPDFKGKQSVFLPIHFNATVPAEMEIIRTDIYTNKEEVIKISNREVNKLAKMVREHSSDPNNEGFRWEYPVKKIGIYRLGKVLDEYKLEVQRGTKDTAVVPCPKAEFKKTDSKGTRCIRDLSDLSIDVNGVPPLKIVYSRTINGKNHSFHFQSLQPDTSSPIGFSGSQDGQVWVQPANVNVGLNESMTSAGDWKYTVDEVHDAFGNVVKYGQPDDDLFKHRALEVSHEFTVKERPRIRMQGCDLKNPLRIAKGSSDALPVSFSLSGPVDDSSHQISWAFSPIDTLTNSGDHGDDVIYESYKASNSQDKPKVSKPGLYTLKSVSSGQCEGQVEEPSTCLVLNPLEPHLAIRTEDISDKCAGNSIGLRVDLDLVGTPPFVVRYDVIDDDGSVETRQHRVTGLRSQLELVPQMAGHYKYVFKTIDDDVYKNLPLSGDDKTLEQVVKPAASAYLASLQKYRNACLDSEVVIDVHLYGEPPFNLEWEMVHEGKRKTHHVTDIQTRTYTIKTEPLAKGGEYILALNSVQDVRACRTFLQDQIKVSVRRQRPRASFGTVENKRSLMAVEDTALRLPLRLQGEGPWNVKYRNTDDGEVIEKSIKGPNDALVVRSRGSYELLDVSDNQCPGSIDASASTFEVDWFPRPKLSLVETDTFKQGADGVFTKKDVCEGDIDVFEINLQGYSPYHIQYEISHKPSRGSVAVNRKSFDAANTKTAISMDTSRAGDYTYRFSGLADNLYNVDSGFTPLKIQQRVNAKPSAVFSKPGQSFKFCAETQEHEEAIPIKLNGVAPFYLEIEIKHQSGTPPETYSIPAISNNVYGMQIPRQHLRLGTQQIRIRRVRDSRGCQQKYDIGGPSVQVQLFDAPTIHPLEPREDYCVGERIAYTLAGTPPFDITYDFNGRWNAKSQTTTFRRVAEKPGVFTITSVADRASECRAAVNLPKTIHPLPSVQISQGRQSRVDIHEGGEVDIQFEFWGSPPFEFTYTRSSNAKRGQKSVVLETRHDISYEHKKIVKASQEGTYEVVAIKDRYCSFSTQQVDRMDGR